MTQFVTLESSEPQLVLDGSGSNGEEVYPGSGVSKAELVAQLVPLLVDSLYTEDTSAEADPDDDVRPGETKGGVLTFMYADGASEIGDLNPSNIERKLHLRFGGRTFVTKGLKKADQAYLEEFGTTPIAERPAQLCIVTNDGQCNDFDELFAHIKQAGGKTYYIGVIYGSGAQHAAAVAQWKKIEQANNHVRLVIVNGVADAQDIHDKVMALIR